MIAISYLLGKLAWMVTISFIGFGKILVYIVEFPNIIFKWRNRVSNARHSVPVYGYGFPSILVYRPIPEEFIILFTVLLRRSLAASSNGFHKNERVKHAGNMVRTICL